MSLVARGAQQRTCSPFFPGGKLANCSIFRLDRSLFQASLFSCSAFRQCSSGLQAVADVASAIKAGYYTIGLAGGVETMTSNPMTWEGGVNPKTKTNKLARTHFLHLALANGVYMN